MTTFATNTQARSPAAPTRAPSGGESHLGKPNGERLQILLVEDNAGDARLLLEMITDIAKLEFDVEHVDRLEEGLKRLHAGIKDLVLVDLGLPDSQGIETFRSLQAGAPNTPTVVISGLDNEATAVEAVRLGAQDFLVKGRINGPSLVRVMRYAIERKFAENRLRESKGRFQALVEHSGDAIAVFGLDGKITYCSSSTTRILGYLPEEMIGRRLADFVRLESQATVEAQLAKCLLQPGEPIEIHADIRHKDGSWRWLEGVFTNMLHDPAVNGIVSNYRDGTERKRVAEVLAREQYLMRTLMNSTTDFIYFKDRDSRFTRVSKAQAHLFGLNDPAQALGKTDFDFFTGVHARQAYEDEQAIIRTGQPLTKEERETWADRPDTWAATIKLPLHDEEGNVVGTFGISRDITDAKQAEAGLRLRSAALDAAATAIVIADRAGTIAWVNPAFTTLTGYSAEEAVGKNPRDLVKSGVHDTAFYKDLWDTVLAGRIWRGEMTNRRKDGTRYAEHQTITPVKDPSGEITHFISIKRDLTQEHALTAQYLQAQKMESVGHLAGGIAHDFNNLLGAITMFGELAAGDIPAGDPRREDLDNIQDAVQRATTLTRQLLSFSRQQTLNLVVVAPNSVITGFTKIVGRLIGEHIELATELDPDAGSVRADPSQIEQVLMNLAVNARDAMEAGGVLRISTRGALVNDSDASTLGLEHAGDYVVMTVSDTGSGMTPEVRAKVFEPFFTTKGAKGTGLGLATVYGIVRQSGGHIRVASEPGKGTTFTIHLPRVAHHADEKPASVETMGAVRGGDETILVAEDDPAVRLALSVVLGREGYRLLVSHSAEEALVKVAAHIGAIDLVISDVVMPGMDGVELIRALRRTRPDLKAVLTSGYAGGAMARHQVVESGIPFLQKPFTSNGLSRLVREVLDAAAHAS